MAFNNEDKVTWKETDNSLKAVFDVTTANTSRESQERINKDNELNSKIDLEIATRKEYFDSLSNFNPNSSISSILKNGLDGQIIKVDLVGRKLYADNWFRTCRVVNNDTEFNNEKSLSPTSYGSFGVLDVPADYIINLHNDRYYKWNGTSYDEEGRVHDLIPSKSWLYNPRSNSFDFYNYWNRYDKIITYDDTPPGYDPPPLTPRKRISGWKSAGGLNDTHAKTKLENAVNSNPNYCYYASFGGFDDTIGAYIVSGDGILVFFTGANVNIKKNTGADWVPAYHDGGHWAYNNSNYFVKIPYVGANKSLVNQPLDSLPANCKIPVKAKDIFAIHWGDDQGILHAGITPVLYTYYT